jgi:hypothetical protein
MTWVAPQAVMKMAKRLTSHPNSTSRRRLRNTASTTGIEKYDRAIMASEIT